MEIEVKKIIFSNQENNWSVFSFRNMNDSNENTAIGHVANLSEGSFYEVNGTWQTDSYYGKQLKVSSAIKTLPKSSEALIRFLSSDLFPGIGKLTAKKIIDFIGVEGAYSLFENPSLLDQIPGLGKKAKKVFADNWLDQKKQADTHLFLSNLGISPLLIKKIIGIFEKNTIDHLSNNPYILLNKISGMSFQKVDKIALTLGKKNNDPLRVDNCILHFLKDSEDSGHCYLYEKQLKKRVINYLFPSSEKNDIEDTIDLSIARLVDNGKVFWRKNNQNMNTYSLFNTYSSEKMASQYLEDIISSPFSISISQKDHSINRIKNWLNGYKKKFSIELSEEQEESIIQATTSKVYILTGGPGVGKSTIANIIVKLLIAMGKKVLLAAPTGRAAQKLQELCHIEAKTIHRLLEWSHHENHFVKNSKNKISTDVIIVDECSMIDIHLAEKLLEALPHTAQILFIGDVDQLPAIGPGQFLSDIIQSEKIPCSKLNKIYRQNATSNIIKIAHKINKGSEFNFENKPFNDCQFIETNNSQDTLKTLISLISIHLKKSGYNQFRDIQILTPMNKGFLGSHNINQEIQKTLNPKVNENFFTNKKYQIRKNDKIIQSVNNYDLNIFNGEIGYVEQTHADGYKIVANFNGRIIKYVDEHAYDLQLAYAITIHKSQGSEFPCVLIPIDPSHMTMLEKKLIYTALTRGKSLVIFVGSLMTLKRAINDNCIEDRQTHLKNELLSWDLC